MERSTGYESGIAKVNGILLGMKISADVYSPFYFLLPGSNYVLGIQIFPQVLLCLFAPFFESIYDVGDVSVSFVWTGLEIYNHLFLLPSSLMPTFFTLLLCCFFSQLVV